MDQLQTPSVGVPRVSLETVGDATLVVQLSGGWRLQKNAVSASVVQVAIEASPIRRVRFDAKALSSWDSSILIFLTKVTDLCRQKNIDSDREGLPNGIRRLLELAEKVQSNKAPDRRRIGRRFWRGSAAPPPILIPLCPRCCTSSAK